MAPTQGQRMDALELEVNELKETVQNQATNLRQVIHTQVGEQVRLQVDEWNKQLRDDFTKVATQLSDEQAKIREDIRLLMAAVGRGNLSHLGSRHLVFALGDRKVVLFTWVRHMEPLVDMVEEVAVLHLHGNIRNSTCPPLMATTLMVGFSGWSDFSIFTGC